MSSSVNANEDLFALFTEVQQPECEDWGTKLQEVCEGFWELLEQDDQVAPQYITAFIKILSEEKSFELARLVIPELRAEPDISSMNQYKQQIIERTQSIHATVATMQTNTQAQFDESLYREEKEALAEAELYRASLLLYNNGSLSDKQRSEVQEWLATRPGVSPKRLTGGD